MSVPTTLQRSLSKPTLLIGRGKKMTDEKDELETFFEGEEHEEISTEVEKTEVKEVETVAEAEKSEEVIEPAPTAEHEQKSVPLAALQDERRKRQHLSEEIEALRKQIPQSKEAPDPYDDIDVYDAFKRNQWQQEQNRVMDKKRREDLDLSRSHMLEQHQDYDEMERIFEIMTTSDRSLVDKMFQSGDAAKYAYDTARAYKDSLLPKHEIETSETVETEKTSVTSMPNLAKATAQASNTVNLEPEADIDDIFADMKY